MPRPVTRTSHQPVARRLLGLATTAVATAALAATVVVAGGGLGVSGADRATAVAGSANPVTPGDFTGYGFDQCLAPTQEAMDRWLQSSPFLAVGIYISGDSRGCRSQPNLTPTWIATQLRRGWRLLPITLGPQASCNPRFPRYGNDETISANPGTNGRYGTARAQGRAEAAKAVDVAGGLGISGGSTLWYDLEAFDLGNTRCRESALAFLSAWTWKVHDLGYVSGVYSSAGSGIKMLDDARVYRPESVNLPDQIWVARWDGAANTSTSYLRSDGWMPHARVKQYQGGHNETWGGVTINIDRDYLDVGRGSMARREEHCGGVRLSYRSYPALRPATTTYDEVPPADRVMALQCLLTERKLYTGKINGKLGQATLDAMHAWQAAHQMRVRDLWTARNWMTILAAGPKPVLKFGSAGPAVRRLQRTLNAAEANSAPVTGVFGSRTDDALRAWQRRVGVTVSGVAGTQSWTALAAARR